MKCKHLKYIILSREKSGKPRQKGRFYISNIVEFRRCNECGKKHQKKVDQEITQRPFWR